MLLRKRKEESSEGKGRKKVVRGSRDRSRKLTKKREKVDARNKLERYKGISKKEGNFSQKNISKENFPNNIFIEKLSINIWCT